MHSVIQNIPNIHKDPLRYVFENLQLVQKPNTLWLEFGVFRGDTINYISTKTTGYVYGFDSFEGLPEDWRPGFEKGVFSTAIPQVNPNVKLQVGWFSDTLEPFLASQPPNTKISFMHIDCDLYSSTKHILDTTRPWLDERCVVVFDELVNYPGYDGSTGELRAWYEYVNENNLKEGEDYEWIGMNGTVGMNVNNAAYEKVAVVLKKTRQCVK